MKASYVDSVWVKIVESEIKPEQGYVYSDLGFYLLAALVKEKTGKRIDMYFSYFEDNKSIHGLDKISNKYIFKNYPACKRRYAAYYCSIPGNVFRYL